MSDQFINSELLVELSTEEQQLITGGLWIASPFVRPPLVRPSFQSPLGLSSSSTRFFGTQSIQGFGTSSGLGGGFAGGFNRSFRSGGVSNVGFLV